jgi:hypothetical protein
MGLIKMSEITITVETKRKFKLPTLPNFIRDSEGTSVPIDELTDKQLKQIGDKWTEALQEKARVMKGQKIRCINEKLGNLG